MSDSEDKQESLDPKPAKAPARVLQLDDGRVVLIGGTLLLLIYSVIMGHMEEGKLVPFWPARLVLDLVRDLGIAFIVGGVVSLGIERISRQRFQDEIKSEIHEVEKSVINAAYLKRYPDTYTAMIEDMLQTAEFLWLGTNVVIDLIDEKPGGSADGDAIVYEQTISYSVLNISADTKFLKPRLFLDADWNNQPPQLLSWKIGKVELDAAQIANAQENATDSTFQRWYSFPKEIEIAPGGKVFVMSKVRNCKFARDTTSWCGMRPSDRLLFTVNHPKGYQVYAQAKTPARQNDRPQETDGRRVVIEIFTPLLPYTTIELGWRPHAPADAPSQTDTLGTGVA